MQGVSGLLGSSGDGAAASGAHEGGGGGGGGSSGVGGGAGSEVGVVGSHSGGFSEEEKGRSEEGDRNSVGNRWPRLETIALLKIRSEMDVVFRDSSLKGPLWEEVSRKLAELGYHRSAKKCKEKFENVYKYHKRTREGRASKPDGKAYRFFDQLEALDNHPLLAAPPLPRPQPPPTAVPAMPVTNPPTTIPQISTVPSAATIPTTTLSHSTLAPSMNPTHLLPPPPTTISPPQNTAVPSSVPNIGTASFLSNSTSSSTSSDEHLERRRKRKRKWKDFFERLMRDVIEKQEELQKKFLEAIEKREHDRMLREEAWRMQEVARMNREHEILVQERSIAAAKDAAVIAFLQKLSDQQNPVQVQLQDKSLQLIPSQPQPEQQPQPQRQPQQQPPPPPSVPLQPQTTNNLEMSTKIDNGAENFIPTASSSRWPKTEVQALIKLRTNLDLKYQESGPKGPLWEEISAAMRKLGYNRSAKRCKEKWENINKYFKKVKESNKKRSEDSKTCPYFHQLDALYREKNKMESLVDPSYGLMKTDNPMVPLMVRPEQQWPLPQETEPESSSAAADDIGSENMEHNPEDDEDDEVDGDEEEDEGGGYEIVTNKASSVAAVE